MAKHYVSNVDQSVRMFRSDLMESLSHVHPAVPHLIFIPVMIGMTWIGYQRGLAPLQALGLFATGVLVWTLTEYTVHRFVFHAPAAVESRVRAIAESLPDGEPVLPALESWRQTFYFIAHGVHHDFPNDSKRLVMPPSVSVPLAVVFYALFRLVLGPAAAPGLFVGFIAGYLAYDTIHYAVHHFSLRGTLLLYLKKLHFRHHYGDSAKDYGVSSPLWDLVWGTLSRGASDS